MLSALLERELNQIDKAWVLGIRKSWRQTLSDATHYQGRIDSGPLGDHDRVRASAAASLRALGLMSDYLDRLGQDIQINKGLWGQDDPSISKTDRIDPRSVRGIRQKTNGLLADAMAPVKRMISAVKSWVWSTDPDRTEAQRSTYRDVHSSQEAWNGMMRNIADAPLAAGSAADQAMGLLLRYLSTLAGKAGGTLDWPAYAPDVVSVGKATLVFGPAPSPEDARQDTRRDADMKLTVHPLDREKYVHELTKARAYLERRGLGFLVYGQFDVEPKAYAPTNPYGAQFSTGAIYNTRNDQVTIYSKPSSGLHRLIAHELGHRMWYKFLTQAQRGGFEAWFGAVMPVSAYGGSNPEEDFAEVFASYVDGADLSAGQVERFKAFTSGSWKLEAAAMSSQLEAAVGKEIRVVVVKMPIIGDREKWEVGPGFRGAEFVSKHVAGLSAILHRSTKKSGFWQLSMFDSGGPSSDAQFATADLALRGMPPSGWKLA